MAQGMFQPSAIDRAPIDVFTPFLFFGGMVSRATGTDAMRTLYLSTLAEVMVNATINHASPIIGDRAARPESPVNMLVDIAAGLGGWFLMDWVIHQQRAR